MFADQLSFEVLEVREYYIPILSNKNIKKKFLQQKIYTCTYVYKDILY